MEEKESKEGRQATDPKAVANHPAGEVAKETEAAVANACAAPPLDPEAPNQPALAASTLVTPSNSATPLMTPRGTNLPPTNQSSPRKELATGAKVEMGKPTSPKDMKISVITRVFSTPGLLPVADKC